MRVGIVLERHVHASFLSTGIMPPITNVLSLITIGHGATLKEKTVTVELGEIVYNDDVCQPDIIIFEYNCLRIIDLH